MHISTIHFLFRVAVMIVTGTPKQDPFYKEWSPHIYAQSLCPEGLIPQLTSWLHKASRRDRGTLKELTLSPLHL